MKNVRLSDPVRGLVMLLAAAVALWKGLQNIHSNRAVFAFLLAALAIAMAVWHFMRRPPQPRA